MSLIASGLIESLQCLEAFQIKTYMKLSNLIRIFNQSYK